MKTVREWTDFSDEEPKIGQFVDFMSESVFPDVSGPTIIENIEYDEKLRFVAFNYPTHTSWRSAAVTRSLIDLADIIIKDIEKDLTAIQGEG